ncbi:MAG: hypothetical protein OCU20_09045 [Methanophagales archaeon]|nr:hypothetical protein [Methanophagales archaeon]
MTISDWIMISAVLLGPILAVQVQKLIEAWRERRSRKVSIFKTLMATRGTTLSPRHVEALNMIDLEFSSKKKKEKKVVDAWKIYLDHLHGLNLDYDDPDYRVKMDAWTNRSHELLTELLYAMACSLGYEFDKVHLKKGSYTPQGHIDMEMEQNFIRQSLVGLFLGKRSLPVSLVSDDTSKTLVKELPDKT